MLLVLLLFTSVTGASSITSFFTLEAQCIDCNHYSKWHGKLDQNHHHRQIWLSSDRHKIFMSHQYSNVYLLTSVCPSLLSQKYSIWHRKVIQTIQSIWDNEQASYCLMLGLQWARCTYVYMARTNFAEKKQYCISAALTDEYKWVLHTSGNCVNRSNTNSQKTDIN